MNFIREKYYVNIRKSQRENEFNKKRQIRNPIVDFLRENQNSESLDNFIFLHRQLIQKILSKEECNSEDIEFMRKLCMSDLNDLRPLQLDFDDFLLFGLKYLDSYMEQCLEIFENLIMDGDDEVRELIIVKLFELSKQQLEKQQHDQIIEVYAKLSYIPQNLRQGIFDYLLDQSISHNNQKSWEIAIGIHNNLYEDIIIENERFLQLIELMPNFYSSYLVILILRSDESNQYFNLLLKEKKMQQITKYILEAQDNQRHQLNIINVQIPFDLFIVYLVGVCDLLTVKRYRIADQKCYDKDISKDSRFQTIFDDLFYIDNIVQPGQRDC